MLEQKDILPKELIDTIQQYVSGKSIYIPCKEKSSGEARLKQSSIIKYETKKYVKSIKMDISVKILATTYSLSEKSIQRILRTTNEPDDFIQ